MLPKLKIWLTAFVEKNKKQTNERTNEPQKGKQKQTNKQTTSKDDSQFPCNCKVYYFMKIWFHFFNVGYGVFGFLDHPLSPFYLIKWLNVTPKYLLLLLFNWNIHLVSLQFIRVSVRDGRNYGKQSMGPPGPPGKPGVRGKQDLYTALCRRYQLSTFCKV